MNTKKLVTEIKKAYEADCQCKMADNGHKIRFVEEGVIELGASYFYQTLARINPEIYVFFGELVYDNLGQPVTVKLESIGEMRFKLKNWPQTSWATQNYRVTVTAK